MNPYDRFGFMPPFLPPMLGLVFLPIFAVVVIWTIVIKGFALWHAARSGQKWWFVVLLIVNTLGILEIIYLIWFRGDRKAKVVVETTTPVAPNSVTSTTAAPVVESETHSS